MHRLRTFRKQKAAKPEPVRPAIDLSTVLPSDKDLRVSVLMPQLSARFSMLREQDDPNTKIGKASDDSVLFNHRYSRAGLGFGGLGALGDISEVSSINGSIRAPFASESRPDSQEGYNTDDDGSIMSRSRPSESNIMFGGRQKIYKIPANSSSRTDIWTPGNSSSAGGSARPMGGKPLYESDVSHSTFRGRMHQFQDERDSDENERQYSPPLAGYNHNRETSSTTSSMPMRSSTAATSINSQAPETPVAPLPSRVTSPQYARPPSRTRRPLYEQGLDQQLSERKTVNRVENLSRQGSYPPVSTGPLDEPRKDGGFGDFNFGIESPSRHGPTPPLSPPLDEPEDIKNPGINATMNVFARQKRHYDEAQYTQRQMQLQRGRETPELVKTDFSHPARQSPPRILGPPAARSVSDTTRRPLAAPRPNMPLTPVDSPRESGINMDHSNRNSASTGNARSSAGSEPQTRSSNGANSIEPARNSARQPDSPLVQVSHADTSDEPEPAVETLSPFQRNPQGFGKAPHLTLKKDDAPTMPEDGLSSMVRSHLRNDSTHSSVYSANSPMLNSYAMPSPLTASHPYKLHDMSLDTRLDFDDWDGGYYSQTNPDEPVPEAAPEPQQELAPEPEKSVLREVDQNSLDARLSRELEAERNERSRKQSFEHSIQNSQNFPLEQDSPPGRALSTDRPAVWNSPIPEDRVQDLVPERRQAPGRLPESPARGMGHSQPEPWAAEKEKMMYSVQNSQTYNRTRRSDHSLRSDGQESGRYSEDTQRRGPKSSTRSSTSGRDRSDSDLSAQSRGDRYRDDLARAMATGIGRDSFAEMRSEPKSFESSPQISHEPLPPLLEGSGPTFKERSQSRSRSRSSSRAGEGKARALLGMDSMSPPLRHAAHTPAYSANHTPPLGGPRKRSIKKSDISDPIFVSSTASTINTVDLPHNGGPIPPPLPTLNPRRRQREDGTRSSGEDEARPEEFNPRLRKATSEGTSLRARAMPGGPSPPIPVPAPGAPARMF